MIRAAVVIGLGAALFICAAFGFFFADIRLSTEPSGERVVVCKLQDKRGRSTDEYSLALARSIAWLLDAQVRVDSPKGTYTGTTTINGGAIVPQQFPK